MYGSGFEDVARSVIDETTSSMVLPRIWVADVTGNVGGLYTTQMLYVAAPRWSCISRISMDQ